MLNPKPLLSLVLGLGLLLAHEAAQAQIVREKPGRVKAANRRALRESNRTESPYKESHLQITRERLKRGTSDQPQPEGSNELHYKNGLAPNVKEPGLLGIRRKKKL
jgi:hypothetical protein